MNVRLSCLSLFFAVAGGLGIVAPAHADTDAAKGPPLGRGYEMAAPERFTAADDSISKIIFVNRCPGGCVIAKGDRNDARVNTSSIPIGGDGEEFTVGEWVHGDETWDRLVACVQDLYGPYDVTVTDVDPGPGVLHHEAIVAGIDDEIGRDGILGIAPMSNDCSPQNNVISFTFANDFGNASSEVGLNEICATVAQESAHAFGLDHAFDCGDPMTYLRGCGKKFFRNRLADCGEFSARQCACSGLKQNSHLSLTTVFGPGTPPPGPTVNLELPIADAAVETGFDIALSASDPRGVERVELWLNDWKWDEQEGRTADDTNLAYFFRAPANLPDGVIDVEIRAFNDLESVTSSKVTVTKGVACTGVDSCLDGQLCEGGRCFWEQPTGVLGDACERSQECLTMECQSDGVDRLCTQPCLTGVNDLCPEQYACLDDGTGQSRGFCWPEATDEGGGCCSVGDDGSRSVLPQLLLGGLVALLVTRRRRAI